MVKVSKSQVKEVRKGKGSSPKTSPKGESSLSAPKRALTAYFLWLRNERPNIAKPGMGVTDVTKRAGELWRSMTASAKKPWEEAAQKDKKRYEEELKAYRKS